MIFVQLLAFHAPRGVEQDVGFALGAQKIGSIVYEDLGDPRGIGVLTWTERPDDLVTIVRPVLADPTFDLALRPELAMTGKADGKAIETIADARRPWAIWFPRRAAGAYEPSAAHEVRFACHGLCMRDNDSVIGLVGTELHVLSEIVQAKRDAEPLARMGPFFVGRVACRHP